jgi:hypothetical protein
MSTAIETAPTEPAPEPGTVSPAIDDSYARALAALSGDDDAEETEEVEAAPEPVAAEPVPPEAPALTAPTSEELAQRMAAFEAEQRQRTFEQERQAFELQRQALEADRVKIEALKAWQDGDDEALSRLGMSYEDITKRQLGMAPPKVAPEVAALQKQMAEMREQLETANREKSEARLHSEVDGVISSSGPAIAALTALYPGEQARAAILQNREAQWQAAGSPTDSSGRPNYPLTVAESAAQLDQMARQRFEAMRAALGAPPPSPPTQLPQPIAPAAAPTSTAPTLNNSVSAPSAADLSGPAREQAAIAAILAGLE